MFNFKSKDEVPPLNAEIQRLLEKIQTIDPQTDEYGKIADQLDKLYKMKSHNKENRVSYDTLILVAGNIVGIMMILGHERFNVVTSKAVSFVLKPR